MSGSQARKGATVEERSRFTADEWQTLQFAPFWIFSSVLGTYRDFDPLDYAAFSHCLRAAATGPGRLVREVLESVVKDQDQLSERLSTDERTIGRGLRQVVDLLDRTPRDEAELFKEMLISGVGAGFARARGRYGQIMSEDDSKTLELIAQFLT